ncbi:phosphodiesterase [Salinicola sp. JS01]|uniref:phosphodiesterase n=1 Tax=Salinicola TaxID=404432 RepID=UPI000D0A34AB|nr:MULTISPECIES: phosphodiesterase [Salinicola]WIX31536.1 phosphodiesterase [Salinicola sp. JS01]
MRVIQITDCHLLADPQGTSRKGFPLRQLQAVLRRAAQLRPDVLLVTGDVSQDETSATYRLASEAFARLGCPWFWIPGNHDQPELMAEWQPALDEIDLEHWRILLLDTRISGQPGGAVGQTQLQHLAAQLEDDDRPTLIAMHHPPLAIGSVWMDAIGLEDRDAFWQTLAPYPQVRAVLCGHIHQAFAAWQGLVAVYGCPATSDQFLPGSHEFSVDEAARPGLRVVDLEGDRLSTWIERVEL